MLCVICAGECSGELALSTGQALHTQCYEQLSDKIAHFKTQRAAPLPSERILAELEQQRARLQRDYVDQKRLHVQLIGFLRGSQSPLESLGTEIASLQLRAQTQAHLAHKERVLLDGELNAAIGAATDQLKAVHDFWLTYPPDWEDRRQQALASASRCGECGSVRALHVHHLIAVAQGGSHQPANLRVLCEQCHSRRHGGKQFSYDDSAPTSKYAEKVDLIQQAIDAGECIRFSYRKYEGESSTRTIRPDAFSRVGKSTCLSGHCFLRNAERVFAVQRMSRIRIVEFPH